MTYAQVTVISNITIGAINISIAIAQLALGILTTEPHAVSSLVCSYTCALRCYGCVYFNMGRAIAMYTSVLYARN
jgi:hypothetical protein